MANTEGMSDETMESLLSIDEEYTHPALRRRMEMLPGERPAATVKKASKRIVSVVPSPPPTSKESTSSEQDTVSLPQLPVVGSIVERKPRKTKLTKETMGKSRFVSERKANSSAGFPSVNVPLGTFVKAEKSNNMKLTSQEYHTGSKTNDSAGPLLDASERNAQAMLESMTESEINESVEEIQSSLSPDTIRFLKERGRMKNKGTAIPSKDIIAPTEKVSSIRILEGVQKLRDPDKERLEKEQMARILTSIKTYDDLDAAYKEFMGEYDDGTSEAGDDFDLACDLLRSTVPRQNLWAARIVSHRLENDWQSGNYCSLEADSFKPWPYPIMLPVSLRCLLDAPFSRVNGYILHTYVLQSLYNLLRLRAGFDHVVDVSKGSSALTSTLYQTSFLDDAVPVPPIKSYYTSAQIQPINVGENQGTVYATSSSSKSAHSDGKTFERDPMWVLLSSMRIIPRLAQLLEGKEVPVSLLPHEALIAICGILAMIGVRSPGAATAITQHPTLLSNLRNLIFESVDFCFRRKTEYSLAFTKLLCTLARQSRTTATMLDVDSLLQRILVQKPRDDADYELQRWALMLWRTFLRYGLGLRYTTTMLTLSTYHSVMNATERYSLTTDFYSAFDCILRCVSAAKALAAKDLELPEDLPIDLANLTVWFPSVTRTALNHIKSLTNQASNHSSFIDKGYHDVVRRAASYLFLLGSFLQAFNENQHEIGGEHKKEQHSIEELCQFVDVASSVTESCLLQTSLLLTLDYGHEVDYGSVSEASSESLQIEASCCAFIVGFLDYFSTLTTQIDIKSSDRTFGESLKRTEEKLIESCLSAMQQSHCLMHNGSQQVMPKARRAWLNKAHAKLVNFLYSRTDRPLISTIRELAFSVLGRLERGEEAIAAMLLRLHDIFEPNIVFRSNADESISFILMRELCWSNEAQKQLDHSLKLENSLGLSSNGRGPFDLESLLPGGIAGFATNQQSDLVLPFGELWLWQLLSSGHIGLCNEHAETETTSVVQKTLSLIDFLEREGGSRAHSYVNRIAKGGKLYHLMNLSLKADTVFSRAAISNVANILFKEYTVTLQEDTIDSFAHACYLHSNLQKKTKDEEIDDHKMSEEEKKLSEILTRDPAPNCRFSNKCLQALEEFAMDICDVFLDNGAAFPFTARCIRFFLCPSFPSKIRCELMRRLRGLFHLLTIDDDNYDLVLPIFFSCGSENLRGSERDNSEFLDVVSSICDGRDARPLSGFMRYFAIGVMAKDIIIGLENPSSGLWNSKRRIMSLDDDIRICVLNAAFRFKEGNGSITCFVNCVLQSNQSHDVSCSKLDWDAIISKLS